MRETNASTSSLAQFRHAFSACVHCTNEHFANTWRIYFKKMIEREIICFIFRLHKCFRNVQCAVSSGKSLWKSGELFDRFFLFFFRYTTRGYSRNNSHGIKLFQWLLLESDGTLSWIWIYFPRYCPIVYHLNARKIKWKTKHIRFKLNKTAVFRFVLRF